MDSTDMRGGDQWLLHDTRRFGEGQCHREMGEMAAQAVYDLGRGEAVDNQIG